MNSTLTMYILLGFYAVITVQALWERNWWRAMYFVGAIIISVPVLAMTIQPEVEAAPVEAAGAESIGAAT